MIQIFRKVEVLSHNNSSKLPAAGLAFTGQPFNSSVRCQIGI